MHSQKPPYTSKKAKNKKDQKKTRDGTKISTEEGLESRLLIKEVKY